MQNTLDIIMRMKNNYHNIIKRDYASIEDFSDDTSIPVAIIKQMRIPLKRQCIPLLNMDVVRRTNNICRIEHCSRQQISLNITDYTRMKREGMLPDWFVLDCEYDNGKEEEANIFPSLYSALYEGNFICHPSMYKFVCQLSMFEKIALSYHVVRKDFKLESGLLPENDVLLDRFLTGCPGFIVGDFVISYYKSYIKTVYGKFLTYIENNKIEINIKTIDSEKLVVPVITLCTEVNPIIPPSEVSRTSEMVGDIPVQYLQAPRGASLLCGTDIVKGGMRYNMQQCMKFPKSEDIVEDRDEMIISYEEEERDREYHTRNEDSVEIDEEGYQLRSYHEEVSSTDEEKDMTFETFMMAFAAQGRSLVPFYIGVSNDHICSDVLVLILSRIPCVERFRYRILSKHWYNNIYRSFDYYKCTVWERYYQHRIKNNIPIRNVPKTKYSIMEEEFMKSWKVDENLYKFCRSLLLESIGGTPCPLTLYVGTGVYSFSNNLLIMMGTYDALLRAQLVSYRWYYWFRLMTQILYDYRFALTVLARSNYCVDMSGMSFNGVCTYSNDIEHLMVPVCKFWRRYIMKKYDVTEWFPYLVIKAYNYN